ncbi:MAG: hypothetical protein A2Y25_04835 [Candidatus Melainabacteria bacterium GWF2_37_15]|nr:MAG: hypothetical protein A2Y25_04835 [Candidatus Melainabacteria bacterium GWF2_37_15]
MQKSNSENLKKLVTALVVITLFVVSFYYYAPNKKEVTLAEKLEKIPQIELKTHPKVKLPPEIDRHPESSLRHPEQSEGSVPIEGDSSVVSLPQNDKEEIKINTKIKPTDIKDLIADAMETSGKRDPFSYIESSFSPFSGGSSRGSDPGLAGLPAPPMSLDFAPEKPKELVVVKGFLGDKVIAEIKGLTESLAVNESLQGIKVLKVDSANLTCVFQINGRRVTKTMKSADIQDKNVELNYIHN